MSILPMKFTAKLIFPKNSNKEYSATILLCKEIPTFIHAIRNRKFNELELNDENFLEYYHKFLFITNKVLNFTDAKLTYNDEIITPEYLNKLYREHNGNEKLEKEIGNKQEIKKEENSLLVNKKVYSEDDSKSKIDEFFEKITKTKTTEERKSNIPKITFDDIGGIDNIIQEIRESVELPLKVPEIFKHLGIKPHKGILLYGEPGCGKTLIAKAIANETNAHFIAIKASELYSMWTGQSESNLRRIFEEAKERQPSVIYFDEIDSVGRKRTGEETGRYDARFLTQLLTLMDGVDDYGDICVIGSTNRIDILDEALLRAGRFDLKIQINKPDQKGCLDILNKVTKNMPLCESLDKEKFSFKLLGLSGADISFVAMEAGYNCMRRNVDIKEILQENKDIKFNLFTINEEDFNKALNKIVG